MNRFINPYFSGKHLQFEEWEFGRLNNYESQSLFQWNPFCNIAKAGRKAMKRKSQSLFQWNPFCNDNKLNRNVDQALSRNPYFSGILSAIKLT